MEEVINNLFIKVDDFRTITLNFIKVDSSIEQIKRTAEHKLGGGVCLDCHFVVVNARICKDSDLLADLQVDQCTTIRMLVRACQP